MKNKTVLITGASSGMGKVIARKLARSGYKVYAAARRLDKMEELRKDGIEPILMDITKDVSINEGINKILAQEKVIDILINNAGFGEYGAVEDVEIDQAKYQLDVNLFGAARLIQFVLPKMREQKWGKIINITSVGGKLATPFGGWYHASKFALEGLSDSLRNEVKKFGVDVVVVEPGGIKSEWSSIAMKNLQENSKNSPYKSAIDKFVNTMQSNDNRASDPKVIADLVKKAVEAKNPKTRYVGGFMGKPTVFLKWLLPDKLFDKMIASQMK